MGRGCSPSWQHGISGLALAEVYGVPVDGGASGGGAGGLGVLPGLWHNALL